MNTMTLAICGEPYNTEDEYGFNIRLYSYLDEGTKRIRPIDANYALGLVQRLTDSCSGSKWIEGEPPKELTRLFDVIIEVENHGKSNARYSVDYHRYNGCPHGAVEDGMMIYSTIKKFGIRPTMKKIVANEKIKRQAKEDMRKEKEEKEKADALIPHFDCGAFYSYSSIDEFGHKYSNIVQVTNITSDRKYALVFGENTRSNVRIYTADDGCGEYFHCLGKIVRAADRINSVGFDVNKNC